MFTGGEILSIWGHLKLVLALTIPLGTIAYAQQLRHDDDCRRIESIVENPRDIDWYMSHPHEAMQKDRAETQTLQRLLTDLDR